MDVGRATSCFGGRPEGNVWGWQRFYAGGPLSLGANVRFLMVDRPFGKPRNRENGSMNTGYRTLKEISDQVKGVSYQKVHRAVSALRNAEIIAPWHGENNELRLTLDDGLRLSRFLGLLRNGDTLRSAIPKLESEMLRSRVRELEAENDRLKALVEWKPSWWSRVLRRLLPSRLLKRFSTQPVGAVIPK